MPSARPSALPPSLPPRGLSREEAAAYVGVSPGTFDKMVAAGEMPAPKMIRARRVWDRVALDTAFAALPDAGGGRPDDVDDVWGRAAV
jgi:excisionase family DNA binding protein